MGCRLQSLRLIPVCVQVTRSPMVTPQLSRHSACVQVPSSGHVQALKPGEAPGPLSPLCCDQASFLSAVSPFQKLPQTLPILAVLVPQPDPRGLHVSCHGSVGLLQGRFIRGAHGPGLA